MQVKAKIVAGAALTTAAIVSMGLLLHNRMNGGNGFRKEKPLGPECAVFPQGKTMDEVRDSAGETTQAIRHPMSGKGV